MSKTPPQESRLPAKVTDFDGYDFPHEMSNPRRAAHALAWLAKKKPGAYVAWNILYRVVVGCARTPLVTSVEVRQLRRASGSVRKILFDTYKLNMVVSRDLGARATYDELDKSKNALVPALKKQANINQRVSDIIDNIDVAKIPKTAEAAPFAAVVTTAKRLVNYHNQYPPLKPLEEVKKSE